MKVILEISAGAQQGKQLEARSGQTIKVGRAPEVDFPLEDTFLSGAHFAVECGAAGCRVRDLESRNGTRLNGELIIEASLENGDLVHAGHTDFIVRIESAEKRPTKLAAGTLSQASRPKIREAQSQKRSKKVSAKLATPRKRDRSPAPKREEPRATVIEQAPSLEKPAAPIAETKDAPVPPSAPVKEPLRYGTISAAQLDSYEAATPDGRLLHILSSQPGNLIGLIDATRDRTALELLRASREEYRSLYRENQDPDLAPHLVRLPPRCELLKRMIRQGWGREWGVYLVCPLSLSEVTDYFRATLMVTLPDGTELCSRFYDPSFFRGFLESCNAAEAEKFFGPISSYFMESERAEILLQFRKTSGGAEKKGHLLSDLN
jgi:pSer/pThr/pTyr-binding forkhead associated (FHA) protein